MPLATVETAVTHVRNGGVIAYPTEAVYGLGCDPSQAAAVRRILQLKARQADKGLIVVASDWSQLEPFIAPLAAEARARIEPTWPGPVTWILPAAPSTNPLLTGQRTTIAARISSHPTVHALCTACGHALVSTSANTSGEAPLLNTDAIHAAFGANIDAIVSGELGGLGNATPIFDSQTGAQLR